MNSITEPLRLAAGNHKAGSGKGCAMNLVSWENGDTVITDLPTCSDSMLARIVQGVNDSICTHTGDGLLCAPCSVKVLDLAHRTVGTGGVLSGAAMRVVWVRVACELARDVAHLNPDPRVMAAIVAAETWAENPTYAAADAAADAANAAARAAADQCPAARDGAQGHRHLPTPHRTRRTADPAGNRPPCGVEDAADGVNGVNGVATPQRIQLRRTKGWRKPLVRCPLVDVDCAPMYCHADVLLRLANS